MLIMVIMCLGGVSETFPLSSSRGISRVELFGRTSSGVGLLDNLRILAGSYADLSVEGDALKKILETPCIFNCTEAGDKIQSVADMNACTQKPVVDEDIDGCELLCCDVGLEYLLIVLIGLPELPGGYQADYGPASE